MIGIRIRRPESGAVVLDTTDYTVSVFYSTQMYVTGSGSVQVPGLNSTDFFPMFMPADEIPWIRVGENYDTTIQARMPKLSIQGSSIVWDCSGGYWNPRWYIIMAVRFR